MKRVEDMSSEEFEVFMDDLNVVVNEDMECDEGYLCECMECKSERKVYV